MKMWRWMDKNNFRGDEERKPQVEKIIFNKKVKRNIRNPIL